jgi:hypothetical protein
MAGTMQLTGKHTKITEFEIINHDVTRGTLSFKSGPKTFIVLTLFIDYHHNHCHHHQKKDFIVNQVYLCVKN